MSEVWNYDGKRVVVTGCASGMGEATVRELADLGAEVVGLDINEPQFPVKEFIRTDLSDEESIEKALRQLDTGIQCLFNCAGLPNTFPGQQVMLVNFAGLRHLTEGIIPLMAPGGAIASISSVAGMGFLQRMDVVLECVGQEGFAATRAWCEAHEDVVAEGYTFSKECIVAYTMLRSYGLIRERGIRINCISPGPTDTPMMPHFERAVGKQFMDEFPKPIGRNSRPEEQAYPLVFLNSDAASYITGHNLFADGGFLAAVMTGQIDPSVLAPPARA